MRGRKPTPTKLKILHGNPGKRKINADEPQPDNVIPTCPAILKGEARAEWKRVTEKLHRLGLINEMCRGLLAGYCQAYALWHKANRELAENGEVITTKNGAQLQNAWLSIANRQMVIMKQIASEFGFTPSSLSRLKQPGSGPASGKLAKYVSS